MAVLIVELVALDPSGFEPSRATMDWLAGALGRQLRATMREPDRIARMSASRFNLLLPETRRPEARRFAERVRTTLEPRLVSGPFRARLRVGIAAPGRDESLEAAMAQVEAELGG